MGDVLVVGVGSSLRGDDAVGLEVVRRLAALDLDGVEIVESDGEPEALMRRWEEAEAVIVVDAISSGSVPGTLRRIDAGADAVPAAYFRHSTHLLGIGEAIELARALERLPARLVLIGVEGEGWTPGAAMTERVARAVSGAVDAVLDELEVDHA